MNDDRDNPSLPPPLPAGAVAPPPRGLLDTLLKNPRQIAETLARGEALAPGAIKLLTGGLVCHAVFGIAIGLFCGGGVAAMDAVKVPLIALFSLLLCLPSLYVFSCVAGTPLSLSQAAFLGCACLAMTGFILVGLAPVAWLFAVSTASAAFMTMLIFLLWLAAIAFTSRFLDQLRALARFQRQAGIKLWLFILLLVTLQMTTTLRPLLAPSKDGWCTGQKQFFLGHFVDTLDDE